jgi:hypothetical protein
MRRTHGICHGWVAALLMTMIAAVTRLCGSHAAERKKKKDKTLR